jgi:hypothetical protein
LLGVLAACNNKPPTPTADPPAAAASMPADHPPVGTQAAPISRLPPDTVMARVGKTVVTAAEVTDALAVMPGADRLEYTTPAMIRELVESLVDRRLMAAAARSEGLDEDPVVKEMLSGPAAAGPGDDPVLAGAWLERELAKAPEPGDGDVTRYYDAHREEFTAPARVRITRIVVKDEATARVAKAELWRGARLSAINAAGKFTAEELWLQGTTPGDAFVAAALALGSGEVSAPLAVPGGFAVIRAEERHAPELRPLADVRGGIEVTLQDSARQSAAASLRERLRKGVDVTIVDGAVETYLASPAGGAVASGDTGS